MGQPKVSIVIPTYNREKILPRAIDSVLAQTYVNWELLIVDDCSSDNSLKAVEDKYSDPRLRVLEMFENGGANRARNKGVIESEGKYIAFLDSDDVMHPQAIEAQVEKFEKNDIGICYVGATYFSGNKKMHTVHHKRRGWLEKFLFYNLKGLGASTSGFMVGRLVFEKIGFFDEKMPSQQDLDFLVRVARYFKIDYLEECNTHMYLDERNRISDNKNAVLKGEEMFYYKHKARARELGVYSHVSRKMARKYALHGKDLKNAYKTLFAAICFHPLHFYSYIYILKLPFLYWKK